MTIPCANCGEPLPDDAHRCPVCDALAPLPAAPGTTDGRTETLPWAIPIRDGPGPDRRGRDPMRPVMYAVLAIALLAGLVAAGQVLGSDGGDDSLTSPDTAAEGDTVGSTSGATTGEDASPDRSTSTSATSTSTPTSSSSTSTSTSAAPTTTSTTAAPTTTAVAGPGSAPVLPSSFRGGWVAQLTSVPASAGADAVEAAWSEARSYASGAVVTPSGDWSSMQPGYWVVVAPGPFRSADDARSYCASIDDPAGADCLPRELTGRR